MISPESHSLQTLTFLDFGFMTVHQKLPQIIRQGQAVRIVLFRVAFVTFVFTTVILLVRPSVGPMSIFAAPTWTIPILTALCFLPTTTPLFLFCLECIGTARILSTVHPYASNQKQTIGQTQAQTKEDVEASQILDETTKPPRWLLFQYIKATLRSRLKSSANTISNSLLTIPPASVHLLEKLGLVTCICLIDDELACEPHSTPQQLLIPSKDGGLKILDLCPAFNEDDEYSTDEEDNEQINNHSSRSSTQFRRSLDVDVISLDSDDDENQETRFAHSFSKKLRKRYNKKRSSSRPLWFGLNKSNRHYPINSGEVNENEVQFEDPTWWQFLPSLKSIGLACMLIENESQSYARQGDVPKTVSARQNMNQKVAFDIDASNSDMSKTDAKLLVEHLCIDRERKQLRVLSRCIGFTSSPNELGSKGDLSSFVERRRLHIISSDLLRNRLQLKQHAMGLEEYR